MIYKNQYPYLIDRFIFGDLAGELQVNKQKIENENTLFRFKQDVKTNIKNNMDIQFKKIKVEVANDP